MSDELREVYQFDYSQAKPNRFAAKIKKDGEVVMPAESKEATGRVASMRSLKTIIVVMIVTLLAATVTAQDPPPGLSNSLKMEFRLIPKGKFVMGVPRDEYGRLEEDELPQHEVAITRPFYMGVYEVTQSQYESVTGVNPSHFKNSKNNSQLPVENVTWYQAHEFCVKLSDHPQEKSKGRKYRLPTEAEWEYACRAGTKTAYGFGADRKMLGQYAWYLDNSGEKTHPVGEKLPNPFGLYDMHGNVSEWCSDWFATYPSEPVMDPHGPITGDYKVHRGSSFNHWAIHLRSGNRSEHKPNVATYTIGFRVVLEVSR